ncbi:MAG: hypothetical protein DCO96_14140 [Fluviicola sp. XM-24bin1]|nr:MAG: hypothetical protein DCO96_14140 [Fluviicola sp. XM-24bin1]
MSIQEKKAVFNLITTILFMGGYVLYTFGIYADINVPQIHDPSFWGEFMLVMMGVTIVLKIVSYIIFYMIMSQVHKDEDPEFEDDYDKQIEMRSDRNSHHLFMLGFIGSLIPLAMGQSISNMFIILLSAGLLSSIVSDLSKLYYYKNGI